MKFTWMVFLLSFSVPYNIIAVKILTSDEKIIEYEGYIEELKISQTINNLLNDIEIDNDIIPLPDISQKIFSKISTCLKILASQQIFKKQKKLITRFLKDSPAQDLYDFIRAINYLDIPSLLEITCKVWCKLQALTFFEQNINLNFDNAEINELIRKISLRSVKKQYRLDYLKHFPPTQFMEGTFHDRGTICCDFNPTDNTLAIGSQDRTIRIYDVSLKLEKELESGDDHCLIVRYNSNGQALISSSFTGKINIWHLDHDTLGTIEVEREISSLDINHNNIAIGLCDGHITIYNIPTENFIDLPRSHRSNVSSICYNSDGSLLASGEIYGIVALCDIKNQNFHYTIHTPVWPSVDNTNQAIRSIVFGPSQTLVWGLENGDIYFYNIKNHTAIKKNTPSRVNSLSYNDQLKVIASGHDNGTRIFDAQSCTLLHILQDPSAISIGAVSFSKQKNLLATSDPIVGTQIWKLAKNFNSLEKATPNQLKLLALAKLKSKKGEILDLTKNAHLLKTFESLNPENQALLAQGNHVKLDPRKKLLLKFFAHKNLIPIALRDLVFCTNIASQSYMIMQRRHLFFEPINFLIKKLDI